MVNRVHIWDILPYKSYWELGHYFTPGKHTEIMDEKNSDPIQLIY